MFSTIVPNIQYNCPQRLVQLSSILGIFLYWASYCLYNLFLLPLYRLGYNFIRRTFFYVSTYQIFQTTVASRLPYFSQ